MEDIASYHGAPYKVCDGIWVYGNEWKTPSGCCPHDPQQPLIDFIIWHRLYMGMSNIIHDNILNTRGAVEILQENIGEIETIIQGFPSES